MAKKVIIETLEKYIALLKAEGIAVNKAFLYGSYSSDTETDDSDIDLMIVTNNTDADNDFIVGKIWKLTRKINTKIEPFLVGLKRFNENNYSPLIDSVKKNGIQII
ncbi:MAG: nucleotidyltransferase domain-containing protein [Proteobacteria bacterium]|nr:nucleotidyltransferase domain-containing protein [Pseudomonadota bacterium]MBU1586132.1 nucleotidyltransferase domain-containing protein [Pseudomonadota bacterium]MBU2627387.1 nucleotidyltransferase domain-containing protein [Pseudomonadota bacterium]